VNVTFDNGAGVPTYGELLLPDAVKYSGEIFGFAGTAADSAHSDTIELAGFKESSYSEQSSAGNLVLTLSGATGSVQLTFADFNGALSISTDAQGDTIIQDPAVVAACPKGSAPSTNGAINNPVEAVFGLNFSVDSDNFTFLPGGGASTNGSFSPQNEKIEFDHCANVQTVQHLAWLSTPEPLGGASIGFDHCDGDTPCGTSAAYLHAHLSGLAHLL